MSNCFNNDFPFVIILIAEVLAIMECVLRNMLKVIVGVVGCDF
jgi:hypothetical protein